MQVWEKLAAYGGGFEIKGIRHNESLEQALDAFPNNMESHALTGPVEESRVQGS